MFETVLDILFYLKLGTNSVRLLRQCFLVLVLLIEFGLSTDGTFSHGSVRQNFNELAILPFPCPVAQYLRHLFITLLADL
jgi:hypothetical protein